MKHNETNFKKTLFITGLTIAVIAVIITSIILIHTYIKNESNQSDYFIELSFLELKEKTDNKENFILVVSKTGCQFCEQYEPVIKAVLEEYKIKGYKVDTSKFTYDEKTEFKNIANVSGTPTTVFINNGTEETVQNRLVGNVPKTTLINRLKDLKYIEEE